MTSVTVVGVGNVASAVADLARRGGAEVQVLARDASKAQALASQLGASAGVIGDAISGDIVVLAVPYTAVGEIASAYGDQLNGKVLVDVSNPVDMATFDGLVVAADSSASAELQALAPGANIVKAFNTNFAATLSAGIAGEPATVLIAGDDAEAREALAGLVAAAGLTAVEVGSLKRARELEAIGFLQITLAAQEKINWTGGFALKK